MAQRSKFRRVEVCAQCAIIPYFIFRDTGNGALPDIRGRVCALLGKASVTGCTRPFFTGEADETDSDDGEGDDATAALEAQFYGQPPPPPLPGQGPRLSTFDQAGTSGGTSTPEPVNTGIPRPQARPATRPPSRRAREDVLLTTLVGDYSRYAATVEAQHAVSTEMMSNSAQQMGELRAALTAYMDRADQRAEAAQQQAAAAARQADALERIANNMNTIVLLLTVLIQHVQRGQPS
ncbi:uncharacterized protein LOC144180045 [Haemaphysalis longicornis]